MTHTTHHLHCGCDHAPSLTLTLSEEALPSAKQGFLREAAATTINQLRRAIEAGEDEKARTLAHWLKTENWT